MDKTNVTLSEYEDRLLDTIESNIKFFNLGKFRTNHLSIELSEEDCVRADLYKGNVKICSMMTLDQLLYAVTGISNYNRK